jgi:hypothetical protein
MKPEKKIEEEIQAYWFPPIVCLDANEGEWDKRAPAEG